MASPTARGVAYFADRHPRQASIKAALWQGQEEATWSLGKFGRFDLERDPREENPQPLVDDAARALLKRMIERARRLEDRDDRPSDSLEERLHALGYVG
jgi:hypothetical protein